MTPLALAETTILLLAAGRSTRMGETDKLLLDLGGRPLLAHSSETCLSAGAGAVIVVLRPGDSARRQALPAGVEVVENADFAEGMASSIRAGLARVGPEVQAVVVALADMPDVTAGDIRALVAAYDRSAGKTICRAATAGGAAGHPVLFGRRHFTELAALVGDRGASAVLAANPGAVRLVPTGGENARTDLDTPADWADYLSRG